MTFQPDELRIIGMCAPVLLRMLKSREDRIISKMYGDFRNGKIDQLSALAELACVRDQIHEITSALKQNENQEEARVRDSNRTDD